jgi:hypothetical protein
MEVMTKKDKLMQYEKPELKTLFNDLEAAMGVCGGGNGDSTSCGGGNSAKGFCGGGNGF